jgi:uncharacterized membrane protein YccC
MVKDKLSIVFKAAVLTIVILISYFAGHGLGSLVRFSNNYISGMWCAVTAVVVFDDFPTNAKTLLRDRLLGTLAGAVVAGIIITWLGHQIPAIFISLFIVSVFIIFFKWNGALKIGCITVLIVHFTTHDFSNREVWISSAMRFFEGVVGGTISLVATILLDKARQYGLFFQHPDKADGQSG